MAQTGFCKTGVREIQDGEENYLREVNNKKKKKNEDILLRTTKRRYFLNTNAIFRIIMMDSRVQNVGRQSID